ncbi:hypothetical protein ACFIOY_31700 [Bradyrhizobium sp. TZ2]
METLFDRRSRLRLRKSRLRHAADRRSWLANAIINSIAMKSGAGDQDREWQTVRPPKIVHIFLGARRDERSSSIAYVLRAAFLWAACVAGLWFSETGAQARCDEGKPVSSECVGKPAAGIPVN